MDNWDDMRVFLAVARMESLSAAAPLTITPLAWVTVNVASSATAPVSACATGTGLLAVMLKV